MSQRADLFDAEDERFDMRTLWRLVAWGSSAAVAVAIAVLAGVSQPGMQRLAMGFNQDPARASTSKDARAVPRSAEVEAETRRLAEAVRTLSADRDRMLARIASLEKSLDEVTGSIGRDTAAGQPPSSAPPAPAARPPAAAPADLPKISPMPEAAPTAVPSATPGSLPGAAGPGTAGPAAAQGMPAAGTPAPSWSVATALPLDLPTQSFSNSGQGNGNATGTGTEAEANAVPESPAARSDFGVDIGGGASVEALRALWTSAKSGSGALLDRLRPLVGIREVKPGYVELRLIAGPLADAAAASKLCAALAGHGYTCRSTPFDGQRLALH